MSLLCKLGMHKWSKAQMSYAFQSNVKDYEKCCLRCGVRKKWNVPVE